MITIVDYGLGNIKSITNMLKYLNIESKVTNSADDIKNAERLILPGVGSFDAGMRGLHATGYIDALNHKVLSEKTPILGICLGMQLFCKSSTEGENPGLGWIDARSIRFFSNVVNDNKYKVPHMGWNEVQVVRESFLSGLYRNPLKFYFVHSYHLVCEDISASIGVANYGYDFTCAVQKDNIYGVQFHPEKSHRYGLALLERFNALK